jgi:hypothetical protein
VRFALQLLPSGPQERLGSRFRRSLRVCGPATCLERAYSDNDDRASTESRAALRLPPINNLQARRSRPLNNRGSVLAAEFDLPQEASTTLRLPQDQRRTTRTARRTARRRIATGEDRQRRCGATSFPLRHGFMRPTTEGAARVEGAPCVVVSPAPVHRTCSLLSSASPGSSTSISARATTSRRVSR